MTRRIHVVLFAASLAACGDCGGGERPPVDAGKPDARPIRLVHPMRDGGGREAGTGGAGAATASANSAPLAPPLGKPRTAAELPTTPGADALAALDKAIEEGKGVDLAKARVLRARVRGEPEELLLALVALDQAIAADARLAVPHVERARALVQLGRFADARAALARAKEIGGSTPETDVVAANLEWAAGKHAFAGGAIRRIAADKPSVEVLRRRGEIEHDAGDEVESDRAFEAAEDLCKGGSPIPLAEIFAARGFARLDAGKADDARAFFEEALARVPGHTTALRGLVESLAAAGKKDDALAKLQPALAQAKDPLLLATHARLATGAAAAGARARAKARFEELLTKTPDAVNGAAASFFLEGDPKRALALATKQVEASPTAENLLVLARAQLATGDAAAARTSIETALRAPVARAAIDWTAARIYTRLGEAGKAGELSGRARARNARIESEEPPLAR